MAGNRTEFREGTPIEMEKFELDIEKEPGRVFSREAQKEDGKYKLQMADKMILHLSYMFKKFDDNNQIIEESLAPASLLCVLDNNNDTNDIFETIDDEDNLRTIFGMLHFPIFKHHSRECKNRKAIPRMTPAEFCNHCLDEDDSLLLKLVYALSTGRMKINFTELRAEKRRDYSLANFFACCVAKGMIERVNFINKPGPLQVMLSDVMCMEGLSKSVREFMSSIRLTSGRRTQDRLIIRDEIRNKFERLSLKPLDSFVLSFDNFGFKGKDTKWRQHTIVQIGVIKESKLRELGFYASVSDDDTLNDDSGHATINRRRMTFEELQNKYSEEEYPNTSMAEDIVLPNMEDYKILSKRIFKTIEYTSTLILPSVVHCREILATEGAAELPLDIKSNLGVNIDTKTNSARKSKKKNEIKFSDPIITNEIFESNQTEELDIDDVEGKHEVDDVNDNDSAAKTLVDELDIDDDEEKREVTDDNNDDSAAKTSVASRSDNAKVTAARRKSIPETFYDINEITLDHVLHGDPGTYTVTEKIVKYLEEASEVKDFDCAKSNGELPVRGIIAAGTADGSPAKRWLDFAALDIAQAGSFELRKYTRARIFFGGFHLMMEFLSMRGLLSRSYTAFFARRWRLEEPSLNWIYVIRDPKDALREWREYLTVHYNVAAEAAGSKDPLKIHKYMIERAVQIPTVMAVLFDLRLLEILFMIRDSEKVGVELFLTCLRFSLPLFAVTHATNYCHLVCDFLEWYKMASDAEKVLFKNFYYTKLSPEGKPIWVDRGVEWTVRHLRMFLGHRVRAHNHDRMIERAVSQIPFRIKAKKEVRQTLGIDTDDSYTTAEWNNQTFKLGKAGLHTKVALIETNFWGPGELVGELRCNTSDSLVLADDDGLEHKMNSALLGAFGMGLQRIQAYYVQHHIFNRYEKTRSEQDNSLKLLSTTHGRQINDIETTKIVQLSVDYDKLYNASRVFPRPKVITELTYLREYAYPNMRDYSNVSDRSVLVKALCLYRSRYLEENPEAYHHISQRIECLAQESTATTLEKRSEQIKSLIYSLVTDVLDD